MIKKLFRLGVVLGVIALLVWAGGGIGNILKSKTAYAVGDLTVDWGVAEGNPIFTVSGAAPGLTEIRNVDVTNSAPTARPVAVRGILDSQTASLSGVLDITILEGATVLYGPKTLTEFFADSNSPDGISLSTLEPGAATIYIFRLAFDPQAGNEFQNASVVFDLKIGVAFTVPLECGDPAQYGEIIFGTSGNDNIRGGNKKDLIISFEGDDTVEGRNNNDCIIAGGGNKNIYGGNGRDVIVAGNGNNVIDGGNGRDNITSGSGDDRISGGNNEDEVHAGLGQDVIFGGNGNDKLFGEDGVDSINGGNGKDLCDGETEITCELN